MRPEIGYAVALAILFASAAFGETLTERLRSLGQGQSIDPATPVAPKPGMRFDAKGVEFGPWLWKFSERVKRHWTVPGSGITERGTLDVTFYVQRDGTITEVKVTRPSGTPRYDSAALEALIRSSPAPPLPGEYPDDRVFFTVTFQYNPEETPHAMPSELPVIDNPRSLRTTAPALEVFTIEGGTIYHRENCIALVGHRKVKVADRSGKSPDIRTTCWICQPDGPRDAPKGGAKREGLGLTPAADEVVGKLSTAPPRPVNWGAK